MGTKPKLKRGSVKTRTYEKGSMRGASEKTKEDYEKINFKNKAMDRWNKITERGENKAARRRKSATPFAGISGLGGFGSTPKLGSTPQRPRRRNA